ncbi:hypothetical protein Jab_2c32720 [Janthinobacterium sp. HH01]|uniref:hypothetical protein n=1 Tax=Janthinobacterium sp. HH01 TaxID=1198452 RepID=UPI0002AEC93F|nr:hypothetical protein [Janthinobacterium sp. HH01]ELX11167.1 hypothetical protein Jab_2c32720 [Janthinobacterium sp. HH01]
MKSSYLRPGLALLCAALLNACGGGNNGNLLLSGTITGLTKPDLVLVNNKTGEKLPVPANSATFSFTKLIAVDEAYDVQIVAPGPTGAKCEAVNGSNVGKANAYTAYPIAFKCVTNPWTLGGNVSGLLYPGLVLANGSDLVSVQPAAGGAAVSFAFQKVGDGSPYGVTVLSQPKDTTPGSTRTQVCTVANGTGNMPAGDFLNVVVSCK